MLDSKVSVLISTYNRSRYLVECLESILNQTIKPHQFIVINDGSSDSTSDLLKRYSSDITILEIQNSGKAVALNYGLNHVTGDYVWFFDDDDVALPNSIEMHLHVFDQNPEVDVVYSSHYFGRDGENYKIQRTGYYKLPNTDENDFFYNILTGCFFTLQGALIKTSCFSDGLVFDSNLLRSQDYDLIIKLARERIFKALCEPTFIFRKHDGIRGGKGGGHDATRRELIWLHYDGLIGKYIRDSLNITEYMPSNSDNKDMRLALFRRMTVMASKGLINEMMMDLKSALQSKNTILSHEESLMLRQSVCFPYFLKQIPENKILFFDNLKLIIYADSKNAIYLLRSFFRGFFWVVRQTDIDRSDRLFALLSGIKILKITIVQFLSKKQ